MKNYRNALFEICDPAFLEAVWRDFYNQTPKRKRNSCGVDGVTFYDLHNSQKPTFSEIRDQLLAPYTRRKKLPYQTSPLNVFTQEKPNRKDEYRIICIPTLRDRLIQKAVLQYFENKSLKFDSLISFGTGRKRTVKMALNLSKKLREKNPYVYKTDITSFFDQIPREKISNLVNSKIRHKSLHSILLASISAEIKSGLDKETRTIISKQGIEPGKGLRQGLPLSPLLSNLFLKDFDDDLRAEGIKVIRYADDMIVFCKSRSECLAAHAFCKSKLLELGLNIPNIGKKSKTQIYEPDQEAEFLGLGIYPVAGEYKIRITKKQIDKVWKKFEAFGDIDENISKELTFSKMVGRLDSMIEGYRAHYDEADNFADFEKNLTRWKDRVIRDILLTNYNIDLSKLTKNQKYFLHLH